MSMAAGPAYRPRPAHEPRPTQPARRRLRAVAPVQRAGRLPFLLLAGAIVVGGVLGLVSLNVSVNQQSFTIAKLQTANRAAENRYAGLQAEIDRLKSPDRIARAAERNKLQPAGRPRVESWPGGARGASGEGGAAGGQTSPGAATSPAAPGAGVRDGAEAWSGDPFPLKQYLAEP